MLSPHAAIFSSYLILIAILNENAMESMENCRDSEKGRRAAVHIELFFPPSKYSYPQKCKMPPK